MSSLPSRTVILCIAVIAAALLSVLAIMRFRNTPSDPASKSTSEQVKEIVVTHQVSDRHWVVAQVDKEEYLKDLAVVSKHILLKPNLGEKEDSVTHVTIVKVSEDSPMYAAGLRKGDELLTVNGSPIETMSRAINLVHEVKQSDDLAVKVKRGENTMSFRFEFR